MKRPGLRLSGPEMLPLNEYLIHTVAKDEKDARQCRSLVAFTGEFEVCHRWPQMATDDMASSICVHLCSSVFICVYLCLSVAELHDLRAMWMKRPGLRLSGPEMLPLNGVLDSYGRKG